jgi:hydrogenase maturation protease
MDVRHAPPGAVQTTDVAGPVETTGPVRALVIGCGNLLRGDDGVGPVLIRHLLEAGLPDGVGVADGGTGGMDVAFRMRGVERVILVDACTSGSEPGALFKLPGSEVEQLPPLGRNINLHAFRWDHALAFARWLLKDDYPKQIDVYLIEAAQFDPGAPLSAAVLTSMHALVARLRDELADVAVSHAA